MNLLAIGGAVLGIAGAAIGGKYVSDQLRETRKALQEEMDKTRDTALEVTSSVVTAFPGGMFNVQLSNLWGSNEKKRDEARQWFSNIIGGKVPAEPETAWEVFVTSELANEPLTGRIMMLPNDDPALVTDRMNNSGELKPLLTHAFRPLTEAEAERRVDEALKGFSKLAFEPTEFVSGKIAKAATFNGSTTGDRFLGFFATKVNPVTGDPNVIFGSSHHKTAFNAPYKVFAEGATKAREAAVEELKKAMSAAFQRSYKQEGPPARRIPWHPFMRNRLLVVTLDAEQWQKHQGKLTVRAVFDRQAPQPLSAPQKAAATTRDLSKDARDETMKPESFDDPSHRFSDPQTKKPLVYGVLNLGEESPLSFDGVKALEELRKINAELVRLRQGN